MSKYILDSSAILAFMNKEPGYDVVEQYLPNAIISTVNIAEVVAVLSSAKIPNDVIESILDDLDLEIIDFDFKQALQVGLLRNKTKSAGLSFGDRACINLGIIKNIPVVTADKIWGSLDIINKVILIR